MPPRAGADAAALAGVASSASVSFNSGSAGGGGRSVASIMAGVVSAGAATKGTPPSSAACSEIEAT